MNYYIVLCRTLWLSDEKADHRVARCTVSLMPLYTNTGVSLLLPDLTSSRECVDTYKLGLTDFWQSIPDLAIMLCSHEACSRMPCLPYSHKGKKLMWLVLISTSHYIQSWGCMKLLATIFRQVNTCKSVTYMDLPLLPLYLSLCLVRQLVIEITNEKSARSKEHLKKLKPAVNGFRKVYEDYSIKVMKVIWISSSTFVCSKAVCVCIKVATINICFNSTGYQ